MNIEPMALSSNCFRHSWSNKNKDNFEKSLIYEALCQSTFSHTNPKFTNAVGPDRPKAESKISTSKMPVLDNVDYCDPRLGTALRQLKEIRTRLKL